MALLGFICMKRFISVWLRLFFACLSFSFVQNAVLQNAFLHPDLKLQFLSAEDAGHNV
jgi:hypothetical protein